MCQQTLDLIYTIGLNLIFLFVGIVLALFYENLGAPRLIISRMSTSESVKSDGRITRFLHLEVKNNPRKGFLFVTRQTAYSCHGTITFLTVNNRQIGNPMDIRWDRNPEPLIPAFVNNDFNYLLDNRLMRSSCYIDIPPGESESLAIAVRIKGDTDAFGWTSESYSYDWRHPGYRFPFGKYVAKISLTTGDGVFKKDFRFTNPKRYESFDLISS